MPHPDRDLGELLDRTEHALADERMLLVLHACALGHVIGSLTQNRVGQSHQADIVNQGRHLDQANQLGFERCPFGQSARQPRNFAAAGRALGQAALEESHQQPNAIQQSPLE
jgi:hypothetical protein